MESVRRGYLYRHIRKDKDEVFYIGIGFGKNHARAYSHRSRNRYWKYIVASTDFDVEILFDSLPEKQLVEKEKEFIALYGRKDLKEGVLANMTDGGEGTARCFFENTKTWKNIKSDPEKYRIICENKRQPFNIIVKEPNKKEYTIECSQNKEFQLKTGLSYIYLHSLINVDHKIINQASRKHKFPLGTVLRYEKLEKKKLVYPKNKKIKYKKPFDVLIYDKDGILLDKIFCGDNKQFSKNTMMNMRALVNAKRMGFHRIEARDKKTKHQYPIGAVMHIELLGCDRYNQTLS